MKRIFILNLITILCIGAFAQQSLSEKIYNAYNTAFTDIVKAKAIIETINEAEVLNLPDTSRFDYHYIIAAIASADGNTGEAIRHLKETKNICETSMGIRQAVYLEIMNALASAYEETGDLDNALAIYQEGIVKGLKIRSWNDAKISFGNLNSGLSNIYEKRGWLAEVPSMWRNAWDYWDKTSKPFETYNVFPLYMLQDYYNRRERYEESMDVNNEMSKYILTQTDSLNPTWCDVLCYRGSILGHLGKYKEAVKAYTEGISIAKQNNIKDNEFEESYGNLICALAEYADKEEIEKKLNEIKDNCPTLYPQSLFAVSYILEKRKLYQDALSYVNQAIPLVTGDIRKKYEWYASQYSNEYNNQVELDNLLSISVPTKGSSEWFSHMEKLANSYYVDKQKDRAKDILSEMVKESEKRKYPENERIRLVNLLIGCSSELDDNTTILQYSKGWMDYAKKNYGEQSKEYYNSLNIAEVACIKTKDYKQAAVLQSKTETLCLSLYGQESETFAIELHNKGRIAQLTGNLESAKTLYEQVLQMFSRLNTPANRMPRTREYLGEIELQLRERL